jgi:AcrR family transcriptional regulator
MPRRRDPAAGARPGIRELSAQATRGSILRAAIRIFATHGYDGGRVEQISRAAKSHDRMIYYYFGSKEGLFQAALGEIYRRFNDAESALVLDPARPVAALEAVVRFMWGYYRKHPEFIRLLNTENLLRGRHLSKSARMREYSSPAIGILQGVLDAGKARGTFRDDVTARDIYLMIASLGYFYLSNRYTLSAFLDEQLDAPAAMAHWERFIVDAVMRTVSVTAPVA